jgi:hypothetical protein
MLATIQSRIFVFSSAVKKQKKLEYTQEKYISGKELKKNTCNIQVSSSLKVNFFEIVMYWYILWSHNLIIISYYSFTSTEIIISSWNELRLAASCR